jgi:8-oxo-dGTP pyrophosphatase MutT (NUDIX family)
MPISDYYSSLRDKVGHDLLMMPAVAAVIHNDDGHVLMLRHHADKNWSLPAGAIEPGEAPETALIREAAEETGLHVEPTELLGVFGGEPYRVTYPNGDQVEYTVIVFRAELRSGQLEATDEEALEFGWFDPLDPPPMGVEYPTHILAAQRLPHRDDSAS